MGFLWKKTGGGSVSSRRRGWKESPPVSLDGIETHMGGGNTSSRTHTSLRTRTSPRKHTSPPLPPRTPSTSPPVPTRPPSVQQRQLPQREKDRQRVREGQREKDRGTEEGREREREKGSQTPTPRSPEAPLWFVETLLGMGGRGEGGGVGVRGVGGGEGERCLLRGWSGVEQVRGMRR